MLFATIKGLMLVNQCDALIKLPTGNKDATQKACKFGLLILMHQMAHMEWLGVSTGGTTDGGTSRGSSRAYVSFHQSSNAKQSRIMQSKNPTRHHTPDDDPEPGTPGTGEDICPDCKGTGKQLDKEMSKPSDKPCERCDGTGIIVEGIG
jgi:hypothetical protein